MVKDQSKRVTAAMTVLLGVVGVASARQPREVTFAEPPAPCMATVADLKHGIPLDGGTAFSIKRIVGSNLTVIPDAVMEHQIVDGALSPDDTTRAFVVLGQVDGEAYSWRFEYDSANGVPIHEIVKGPPGEGRDSVEVHAPVGLAFRPVSDIAHGYTLHCRSQATCRICCCFVCYCGWGGWCDEDDTGFYGDFESVQDLHTVDLDCTSP